MPRDDLSIDFVRGNMPQGEQLDPAMILDDWINRVQNLPEEIRFIQDEIADKDRQYNDCVKLIEERDGRIQKWIKSNGSHEPNPREDVYRTTIRENFAKADQLAVDKIALTQKLQVIIDKHTRQLDLQIKQLYDRNEPGFTDPDEVPSLLRPSAANHPAPSMRPTNPTASHVPTPLPVHSTVTPSVPRPVNPQIRNTQIQQSHPASAPATPAASMILNRQARESSAGPGSGVPKRGPRVNSGLGSAPTTSSGLARHSSLGPGTPKASTATTGVQRAGSAGPRTTKGTGAGPGRKAGTPTAGVGRKKGTPVGGPGNKSNLSRVKRPSKNSPSASVDSELSDAESGSGSAASSRRGTPAARAGQPSQSGPPEGAGNTAHLGEGKRQKKHRDHHNHDDMDVDDDEAGDDKKYCTCQNVSFGDMVACDNETCPFEWFHWSCVGLKSEPNGTWYCPVCTEKMGTVPKKTK